MRAMFRIIAITAFLLLNAIPVDAQPAQDGPASPIKGSSERIISGGTVSPAYFIDEKSRYIPGGYTPGNSFCYAVFFQLGQPRGGDHYQVWAHNNQWVARAGQNKSGNIAHIECFRPSPPPAARSFVKIGRQDGDVSPRFECGTPNQDYCPPAPNNLKICTDRGLKFVTTGPSIRIENSGNYKWYASWVLCEG